MTTFLGNPVTLEGRQLEEGMMMPDFEVVDLKLQDVKPMEQKGKKIILAVPSCDTGVCSLEMAKFMNATKNQNEVEVMSVSMDLPFALARWCQAQNNENLKVYSDFKNCDFAAKTGTRMAENGLLARSVFVTDEDGKLVYVEYVPEVSHEPNYQAALKAAGLSE